jgi:hypothetical protein
MFDSITRKLRGADLSIISAEKEQALLAGRYMAVIAGAVGSVLAVSLICSATAIAIVAAGIFGTLAHTLWTVCDNYEKSQSASGQLAQGVQALLSGTNADTNNSLSKGTLIMTIDTIADKLGAPDQVAAKCNQLFQAMFNILEDYV